MSGFRLVTDEVSCSRFPTKNQPATNVSLRSFDPQVVTCLLWVSSGLELLANAALSRTRCASLPNNRRTAKLGVPYKIARHYVHEVAESLLEPASGGAHDVS